MTTSQPQYSAPVAAAAGWLADTEGADTTRTDTTRTDSTGADATGADDARADEAASAEGHRSTPEVFRAEENEADEQLPVFPDER